MKYLFAPLEGITYRQYRELHHRLFPGAEEYYTPFIAPDSKGSFKHKYLNELMGDISGVRTVPQLLVNNAEAFNLTAAKIHDLGFPEINLNTGCPSGTVFAKHKGSGMLRDPEHLNAVLDEIVNQAERLGYRVSVKTRMGVNSAEEFPAILEVFNRYPLAKVIVHARSRAEMYEGTPDLNGFREALSASRNPLVFNGNIASEKDLQLLRSSVPETDTVMIGRGAVTDPALFRELNGGERLSLQELQVFHDSLVETWLESGLSPNFTVDRMKTLWVYMLRLFPAAGNEGKRILKAKQLPEYRSAVTALFARGEEPAVRKDV